MTLRAAIMLVLMTGSVMPLSASPDDPPSSPAWLEGYRLRYVLTVPRDPAELQSRTVVASLSAGTWGGADAGAVVVQAADGRVLPTAIVAHDPATDTLIQFTRDGDARTYWAYLLPRAGLTPPTPPASVQAGAARQAAATAQQQAQQAAAAATRKREAVTQAQARLASLREPASQAKAAVEEAQAALAGALDEAAKAALQQRLVAAAEAQLTADKAVEAQQSAVQAARDEASAAEAQARDAAAAAALAQQVAMAADIAADPRLAQEAVFAQVRSWNGASLDDWASVRQGMVDGAVQGHAFVTEVIHNNSPAWPEQVGQWAISYRGFLHVQTAGAYRVLANGDHATFLFIDGQLVDQNPGVNRMRRGRVPIASVGSVVELTAGAHAFEFHQAVGATDQPYAPGMLIWIPPEQKDWSIVPRAAYSSALAAVPTALESAGSVPVAAFEYGMEDALTTEGATLYLVRFQAVGTVPDPAALRWDLGDGLSATGRSVTHLYFRPGPYTVRLTTGSDLPAYQRTVRVWTPPVDSAPMSLAKALAILEKLDLAQLDAVRLRQMFTFLQVCGQPQRWAFQEKLSRHLLGQAGDDPAGRAAYHAALIGAVARQGRVSESMALAEQAARELDPYESLCAQVLLAAADVQRDVARDAKEAARRYQAILDRYRRLEAPVVRQAAIHLGDLYADARDFDQARRVYDMAGSLGGTRLERSDADAAIDRGATLRIVEQKVKAGQVRDAQRLLEKIELEQPQQKLEGIYQVLRGEVDRAAGRYEEAARAYELVLAWPQWSGLRGQAMFGLADCHRRAGRLDDALAWLSRLKSADANYYAQQNLEAYEKAILERQAAGPGDSSPQAVALDLGFEADQLERLGEPRPPTMPLLTLEGAAAACAWRVFPTYLDMAAPLPALQADTVYWVEYWFRQVMGNVGPTGGPHVHVYLYGPGNQTLEPQGRYTTSNHPTVWGQWNRAGALVRSPAESGAGRLYLSARHYDGVLAIDGLRLEVASPAQLDALANFIEGSAR